MKKIILAYSGGLDTSYCLKKLSSEGNEVHAININTGGFSKNELKTMEDKAYMMGAFIFKSIDAIDIYYNKIIKYLIFGNVLRNNTYPLSVSSERVIQAVEIVKYAKKNNATHIAHGSTGAGNDQVRFDSIFQIMAPEIEILTPIRDNSLSREEEINYLNENGINLEWTKAKYSINKGLWGTSVGGDETLTSKNSLPSEAYPSELSKKEKEKVVLSFSKGELVAVNYKKNNPVECIKIINSLCEKFCIGRDIHVGDTIIGIKGRVGFEAGGPIVILKSHHLLEKHVLTKWQQFQKDQLSNFYGMQIHEGNYLDPVIKDIESFFNSSQSKVTGDVFVTLSPYRFQLNGIESKNDLMNLDFGSYGEQNNKWSAQDAKGFIKISSNQNKIYQYVNNEEKN
ncbi:MAG: argininosuccinate synthase [Flavobacteriaceae bacterium]|nr:argininosuccinate synthase [Flavobacteriaceae bacterium]|tara:strand:- start:737 stop:1927 length:1191 start_codon:yes stop_codon:yes gene_type:complete